MKPPKGVCVHCHQFVEHNQSAAYSVSGIEVERKSTQVSKSGGANQIRFKQRVDGWIVHNRYDGDCLDNWAKARESQGEQQALI